MKNNLLIFLTIVSLLIGCKKEEPKPEITTPTVEETAPKTACYLYDKNNDKVELHLQLNEEKASGTLEFSFSEKDKNTGTFEGTFENNILIADYTFQSEGKESVRQIAFQLQGDEFVEGYGELSADGAKFMDISKITFTSTMPLSKINCD